MAVQNSRTIFQNGDGTNNNRSKSLQPQKEHSREVDEPTTPNNNHQTNKWPVTPGTNGIDPVFSASISQVRGYENVRNETDIENHSLNPTENKKVKTEINNQPAQPMFGTIQLNGTRIDTANSTQNYENSIATNGNLSLYDNASDTSPVSTMQQHQNNNQSRGSLKRNGQLSNSCEVIENKLAISNDDLLEAIEQLSMLSKSKDGIVITPKRNNIEKDNTKSNEAKADKERKELEEEDRKKYIAFLQNEKIHIYGNMDVLKRSIADIEIQEEEINREVTFIRIIGQ